MNLRNHDQKCEHGLAIAHTTNEGDYCFGGEEVTLDEVSNANPFRTLVMHDAIKAEVDRQMKEWTPNPRIFETAIKGEITRQLQPAIIAAMTRTTWQLNAEELF